MESSNEAVLKASLQKVVTEMEEMRMKYLECYEKLVEENELRVRAEQEAKELRDELKETKEQMKSFRALVKGQLETRSEPGRVKSAEVIKKKADHDLLCKGVLVGDKGVGKSSLLLRISDNIFQENIISTIGVDFRFIHRNVLDGTGVDTRLKLQIWDTAGQERFRTITSAYYRGADFVAVVFNVNDLESFTHVTDWLTEVNRYSSEETLRLLVGTQCDRPFSDRQVNYSEALEYAQQAYMPYFEVSSLTGAHVEDTLQSISSLCAKSFKARSVRESIFVRDAPKPEVHKKISSC